MSVKLLKISYFVDADFDAAAGPTSQADDDRFVEFVARSGADSSFFVSFQTRLTDDGVSGKRQVARFEITQNQFLILNVFEQQRDNFWRRLPSENS